MTRKLAVYFLIGVGVVLLTGSCTTSIPVPSEYRQSVEHAPVIADGVVIKYYGGSRTILVDFLVSHVRKNDTEYKIPKIITVEYLSSESKVMQLAEAQHATLYIEPAVSHGNRYRWNRLWQYPAFPKTDEDWEGLFQAGRWEHSQTGPWPAPPQAIDYK